MELIGFAIVVMVVFVIFRLFNKEHEREIDKDYEQAWRTGRIEVHKYINDHRQVEHLCQYVSNQRSARRDFALREIIALLADPKTSPETRRLCKQTIFDALPDLVRDEKVYPDAVVQAVASTQDQRRLPSLINLLKNGTANVRQYAARALAKIGDPIAVGPLTDALADDCVLVWEEAALALKELGWQPDNKTEATTAAAFWIGNKQWDRCAELGTSALTPLLSRFGYSTLFLESPEDRAKHNTPELLTMEEDRAAVAATFKRIGMPAFEALVAALRVRQGNWQARPDVKSLVMNASGYYQRVTQRDRDNVLSWFLQNSLYRIRQCAYGILSIVNDCRTVDLLVAALDDRDPKVREYAVRLLGMLGDQRAAKPLAASFERVELSVVVEALANIGGADSTKALAARLSRCSQKDRGIAQIAEALGRIGSPEAREALASNLKRGGLCVARPLAVAGDDRGIAWLLEDVRRSQNEESAVALGMAYRSSRLTEAQKTQIRQQNSLRVRHVKERYVLVHDPDYGDGAAFDGYDYQPRLLRDYL